MTTHSNDNRAGTGERPCAICGKPVAPAYRPFCSRRCADVDLGRWLGGTYAIAAEDVETEERSRQPDKEES